jgi:hypothetical protein
MTKNPAIARICTQRVRISLLHFSHWTQLEFLFSHRRGFLAAFEKIDRTIGDDSRGAAPVSTARYEVKTFVGADGIGPATPTSCKSTDDPGWFSQLIAKQ